MTVVLGSTPAFDVEVATLIIGAGACGLTAALAAHEAGDSVLVLERDPVPSGSTALSAGLIPAAGSKIQSAAGIEDSPADFAKDIMAKADHEPDPDLVAALTQDAGPTIDWLAETYDFDFSVITDFSYPGHRARRMHGLPTRSGQELIDRLRATCEDVGIDILCERTVFTLHADTDSRITGVEARRPDGGIETIGCDRLILACNGFGGNPKLRTTHMPDIGDALYFGHTGNQGEALNWGQELGAATRHLGAYQGHGNVAHPHGILISWAVITEGGVQVDQSGQRFWDESQGYSEAARAVLSQADGLAWTIFDARIADVARQFADFREAEAQGAIRTADSVGDLAAIIGCPETVLSDSLQAVASGAPDPFGRTFDPALALRAPYKAVRVTGALFHTQGGLDVTPEGRVRRPDGTPLPNLFAAGGAACGVSGSGDAGYLSGNGLLSAVVLGRLAGAARPD